MNLSEAKDILVDRIGWENDGTVPNFVVDATNLTTDSGRYFQMEHSAITLQNIKDCQPLANIDFTEFNAYLTKLKAQCVIQVLSDTFEKDYIDDNVLTVYPRAFDDVISLRMVIIISELIMTSVRNNKIDRITDDFVGKLNYDVFRAAPNKFAIRGANYQYSMGIATRYRIALRSLQRRFGNQRNIFRTQTAGDSDVYGKLFK